jgi:type III pantothenate kinase
MTVIMNLVLDIGNTHAKAGWYEHGRLAENLCFGTITRKQLTGILSHYPVDKVIVSSVGQPVRDMFKSAGSGLKKLLFLDPTLPLPLKINYRSPETLGHDRIAAAAGASCIYPRSSILVMDLGTAITIDFVSADGIFMGGNISPGLHTRFKALHEHTARLPLVNEDSGYPEFGHDTQTAIAAGVQQGIIHELNGYISLFESRYPDCQFVVTGGDSGFFAHKLKKIIFAYPDLVLTGLNHILEFNSPTI